MKPVTQPFFRFSKPQLLGKPRKVCAPAIYQHERQPANSNEQLAGGAHV